MKKPKLKKYPTGGSKGFIQDKLVHYVGQGETPYTREQLGAMGYNYETSNSGFDEYSFGDNRRFYKTVMPNSPGWNNPENPYLTNTAKPAVAKVGHKTGPYPSYGSPEYIQAHPEYTPPKPRIPTFAGGGEFAPIPEKDSLYIEDRLKKDPYLSAKYKYKVVEDRKKGDILYRTMPNGKDVPVNFNNMKELDRQAYKVKMDRDLQSTGQKPIYNVFAPPTFKHGGMKLPKYFEGGTEGSSIVSSIGGNMGWFAYANQAKDMGKSMLSKDEYGNYNSNVEKAANEIITPDHEQMMGDIKNKRYDLALLDSTGLGKFARMGSQLTGNSQKTTGNWGKFNSMVGITKDKQKDTSAEDAYNLAEQNRKNNLYHTYAQGGVHSGMPTAEVEKEEVMRMPNGQTKQVDGPSHENGGVPVNIPDGTQIFSDRLKDPTTKKTFAKMAEQYKTNKQDKILNNPKADKTAKSTAELVAQIKQAKLDKLFETQEQLKQTRLNKYAQKLGLDPNAMFKNGGTKLPKYYAGATHGGIPGLSLVDLENIKQADQAYSNINRDVDKDQAWKEWSNQNWDPTLGQTERDARNQFNSYYNKPVVGDEAQPISNGKTPYVPNPNDPYEQAMTAGKEFEPAKKQFNPKTGNYDWIEPTVNTLVQNAGNLAYLAGEGKRYDRQQFYKYNPELYNPADALRQADIEARVTRDRLKDASGGNAGALMSNLQQSQAINTLLKSKIRTDASNQNAGTLNDAQVRNIQGKYQVDDINARNKGQALTNYYNAIRGIGQNTSGAYRDWKRGEVDQQTLDIISKNYPDYVYDKRRKGWYHKSTDKKLE